MEDCIRPYVSLALRLPSGTHKVIQLRPNTSVSLGKYGAFSSNDLLGRPFFATYEIVDEATEVGRKSLRIVGTRELYEQTAAPQVDLAGDQPNGDDNAGRAKFELVDKSGKVLMRTNRDVMDNIGAQKLTMTDIEELKKAESASGKDIIAKIMESHTELDKKTTFSLAKYTTRKANKYMRRFVPLPLDVPLLSRWWLYEKEPKTMDLREETLALISSWSNVHYIDINTEDGAESIAQDMSAGKWLVVDDISGLLVASMAEKMDLLYPPVETLESSSLQAAKELAVGNETGYGTLNNASELEHPTTDLSTTTTRPVPLTILAQETHMSARHNTITVVHSNAQPNLSMLSYFNYDPNNSNPSHPLHKHLKSVSWLSLLHPEKDPLYQEPEVVPPETLAAQKSTKRGAYFRKRRRWERIRSTVDETRAGGFDGLVVASIMPQQASILHHLVPLLRGGAPIVVYNPNVEPLAELNDYYNTARRSAFLNGEVRPDDLPTEDFPVNPTLLLSPTIYTARVRPWQVLSGRTHPLMTGIGGPEGYVLVATRVLPIEGEKVEARGSYKRRKTVKDPGS